MPAHQRSRVWVTSANDPAISSKPVAMMTSGANGTQDGVIDSNLSGAIRCATPAAV